ncbi:hypothetical protein [Malikia sp.]|uniref:hypothetical protein n=1 Tax=Malikia sp. TaxID=2070706 RepID=UPI002639BD0A|nr:hypothetical protein [Malikia sp.]MDD2728277.1 hypothetical protein [Malikia sp.]
MFDSILERHLVESLKRAFEYLGHSVHSTDLIVHGHDMIKNESDKKKVWSEIEKALDFTPDLFISFRPMNLLPEMVEVIKKKCITAIWLSDDPVLYKTCYSLVVDSYDLMLHCGSEKIISFYHAKGHKHGINFPFWTDHHAFPPVYNPLEAGEEVLFLGNMNGQVRRKRYFEFAKLPNKKKIFGLLDSDPLGIHGGFIKEAYLNCDLVSQTIKNFRISVSIPQFFDEYAGLHYDFPELRSLGYFQFPSRVIQYIASGIPVAAVGQEDMKFAMPEIEVSSSINGLESYISKVISDFDFAQSESKKVLSRFRKSYSSLARAQHLLYILNNMEEIRSMSPGKKATQFLEFESSYSEKTY